MSNALNDKVFFEYKTKEALIIENLNEKISENLLTLSIEFFEKKIGPTLIPVTKDLTSFAIAMACLRSGVSRATKIGAFLTTIFQFLTDINFRSIFLIM